MTLPLILTYTSHKTSLCLSDFEERDVAFPSEKAKKGNTKKVKLTHGFKLDLYDDVTVTRRCAKKSEKKENI